MRPAQSPSFTSNFALNCRNVSITCCLMTLRGMPSDDLTSISMVMSTSGRNVTTFFRPNVPSPFRPDVPGVFSAKSHHRHFLNNLPPNFVNNAVNRFQSLTSHVDLHLLFQTLPALSAETGALNNKNFGIMCQAIEAR